MFFQNLGEVVAFAPTGGFPATAAILDISDTTQYFDHDKSSSISQLIKGESRDLQKLLKYFNGTTTSASDILLSFGVLLIIFVLYSKDLLVVVLLLFVF